MSQVTDALQNTVTYLHYADGAIKQTQVKAKNKPANAPQYFTTTYEYDAFGNMESRTNHLDVDNALFDTETFGYDALNRLTASTLTGVTTEHDLLRENVYDGHGNLVYKDRIVGETGEAYKYLNGRPPAVSHVGDKRYDYDGRGNMTQSTSSDGERNITWQSFDKPKTITQRTTGEASSIIQMHYDADRTRVAKFSHKAITTYVGGSYERVRKQDGSEIHKYYYSAAGQTIGYITQHLSRGKVFEAKNQYYLLTDHLGSTDVMIKDDGTEEQRMSFSAWGERRNANRWSAFSRSDLIHMLGFVDEHGMTKGYTGHEQDDEVDLINMNGRLYDAALGRFISADPYVQAPEMTQNFNHYTYVLNNPLGYVDPSGYNYEFSVGQETWDDEYSSSDGVTRSVDAVGLDDTWLGDDNDFGGNELSHIVTKDDSIMYDAFKTLSGDPFKAYDSTFVVFNKKLSGGEVVGHARVLAISKLKTFNPASIKIGKEYGAYVHVMVQDYRTILATHEPTISKKGDAVNTVYHDGHREEIVAVMHTHGKATKYSNGFSYADIYHAASRNQEIKKSKSQKW